MSMLVERGIGDLNPSHKRIPAGKSDSRVVDLLIGFRLDLTPREAHVGDPSRQSSAEDDKVKEKD